MGKMPAAKRGQKTTVLPSFYLRSSIGENAARRIFGKSAKRRAANGNAATP
jgi:hypothetical protein